MRFFFLNGYRGSWHQELIFEVPEPKKLLPTHSYSKRFILVEPHPNMPPQKNELFIVPDNFTNAYCLFICFLGELINVTVCDASGKTVPRPRRRFSLREGHRTTRA